MLRSLTSKCLFELLSVGPAEQLELLSVGPGGRSELEICTITWIKMATLRDGHTTHRS